MFNKSKFIIVSALLLFAGVCFWQSGKTNKPVAASAISETQSPTQVSLETHERESPANSIALPRMRTAAIQDLRVGMRVAGENPIAADTEREFPEPDPATWRQVSARLEHKPGEYVEATLLRPLAWIQMFGVEPGATVWLDLAEMQSAGEAEILAVSPSPFIESGSGSVITGTFKHVSRDVIDVTVTNLDEPIGTTAKHPFWSETRQNFIPASELLIGEEVRTADETLALITSITPRAGPEVVYGLEVYSEHVYHVGTCGALVHNASSFIEMLENRFDATDMYDGFQRISNGQLLTRHPADNKFYHMARDALDADHTLPKAPVYNALRKARIDVNSSTHKKIKTILNSKTNLFAMEKGWNKSKGSRSILQWIESSNYYVDLDFAKHRAATQQAVLNEILAELTPTQAASVSSSLKVFSDQSEELITNAFNKRGW